VRSSRPPWRRLRWTTDAICDDRAGRPHDGVHAAQRLIPVVGVEVAGEGLGGKRRMDFSVAASSDELCTVWTSTTLTC
jgi:hypothetical protein